MESRAETPAPSAAAVPTAKEDINLRTLERAFNTHIKKGGNLLQCRRCGRVPEQKPDYLDVIGQVRSLTLITPATIGEEGRVVIKPKVHKFFICRFCTTQFLKFMQEKK